MDEFYCAECQVYFDDDHPLCCPVCGSNNIINQDQDDEDFYEP